jgi:hypothetical protein
MTPSSQGAFGYLNIHRWDEIIHGYAVFGCMDELARDIYKREYSHEMLEQVDTKNLPDLLIQLGWLGCCGCGNSN